MSTLDGKDEMLEPRPADPPAPRARDGWVRTKAILWFVGVVGFIAALSVILQVTAWIIPGLIVLALIIALPIAWLRRRRSRPTRPFTGTWLRSALATTLVLGILLAAPVFYFAIRSAARPATVPMAVLTNGEREIVFQGMQHVGSEAFYKSVVYDLQDALSRGYVLYYEGVQDSTPEANAWFKQTIGQGQDLSALYSQLGDVCRISFQGPFFAALDRAAVANPGQHVKADVTTAQLLQEHRRLMATDPAYAAAMDGPAEVEAGRSSTGKSMASVTSFLHSGPKGRAEIGGILCRGFMTAQDAGGGLDEPEQRDKLILDYRNRVLAGMLLKDSRPRIYVTYGAKHLPGIIDLLRQQDPRWRVGSLHWVRTMDAPPEATGTLAGVEAGALPAR